VGALLAHPAFGPVLDRAGTPLATALIREDLEAIRQAVEGGTLHPLALSAQVAPEAVADRVGRRPRAFSSPAPGA
jgi:hypothetical protein